MTAVQTTEDQAVISSDQTAADLDRASGGRRLIAHELTHVVQQGAGQSINHVGPSHGEVIQRFPRLMPRPKPRIRFGAPELPPVPPVFPIPADRPNPNPELNNPEDLEDRRQRRCGTYALPETVVTFYPGPKGQGSRVKASPLTLCPGNTRGSKPLESIYQKQFECIKAAGESGKWLRGHLLHGETDRTGDRHLHGPGNTPANLIIITQSLNQQMRSWIEDSALKLVHGPLPHVLWMDVVVDSYHPGLEFFAESISVEYGPYRTSTGREGSPWKRKQFFDLKKPPHCPSYGLWPEGAVPPWVGGSALNTFGFQSTLFIHGGGKANRLSSRNFDVNTGGLIVAIDAKLVPPKCTVEHYYVELMKDKFGRDEQMSRSEISVYPEKWRQVLMWRGLLPGEYYLQIWREDEGVFRKTAGCDLITGAVATARALVGKAAKQAVRPTVPVVLFVWGPGRILPVRVTSFSVEETLFSPSLHPIQATVTLGLEVLTPDVFKSQRDITTDIAVAAYNLARLQEDSLAVAHIANNREAIKGLSPF